MPEPVKAPAPPDTSENSPPLTADVCRDALPGFHVVFRHAVASTSTLAAELVAIGLALPAAVVADEQTAGRGRRGKAWLGRGGVTVTFAFPKTALPSHHVALVAAVLARRALGEAVEIKWPNDLLLCDRKVAGLLCERIGGVDLVGIGVNVESAPSVGGDAVPAGRVGGSRQDVLRQLGSALSMLPDLQRLADVADEYRAHQAWRGEVVEVGKVTGPLIGMSASGFLLVGDAEVSDGTVRRSRGEPRLGRLQPSPSRC